MFFFGNTTLTANEKTFALPFTLQLLNMSLELSELKTSLQVAETVVATDLEHMSRNTQVAAMVVPSFSTSEAAVQSILECLKGHELTKAVRYIQEFR